MNLANNHTNILSTNNNMAHCSPYFYGLEEENHYNSQSSNDSCISPSYFSHDILNCLIVDCVDCCNSIVTERSDNYNCTTNYSNQYAEKSLNYKLENNDK